MGRLHRTGTIGRAERARAAAAWPPDDAAARRKHNRLLGVPAAAAIDIVMYDSAGNPIAFQEYFLP